MKKVEDFLNDGPNDEAIIAAMRKPVGWEPGIEGAVRRCQICTHHVVCYRESAKRADDGRAHLVCYVCYRRIVKARAEAGKKEIHTGGIVKSNEFDWNAWKKKIN